MKSSVLYHARGRREGSSVFGRGRTKAMSEGREIGAGIGLFRCTDRDKQPPSRVVTAALMGDPAPDRPKAPPPIVEASRISTVSGPVLLTFRELEAARRLGS